MELNVTQRAAPAPANDPGLKLNSAVPASSAGDIVGNSNSAVLPVAGSDATRIRAQERSNPTELQTNATVGEQSVSETSQEQDNEQTQPTSRQFLLDDTTQDFIFQVVTQNSGEVLNQVPSEALLKIRQYNAEQEAQQSGRDVAVSA